MPPNRSLHAAVADGSVRRAYHTRGTGRARVVVATTTGVLLFIHLFIIYVLRTTTSPTIIIIILILHIYQYVNVCDVPEYNCYNNSEVHVWLLGFFHPCASAARLLRSNNKLEAHTLAAPSTCRVPEVVYRDTALPMRTGARKSSENILYNFVFCKQFERDFCGKPFSFLKT